MVQDVLAIQKCGPESTNINQVINSFIESDKWTPS